MPGQVPLGWACCGALRCIQIATTGPLKLDFIERLGTVAGETGNLAGVASLGICLPEFILLSVWKEKAGRCCIPGLVPVLRVLDTGELAGDCLYDTLTCAWGGAVQADVSCRRLRQGYDEEREEP